MNNQKLQFLKKALDIYFPSPSQALWRGLEAEALSKIEWDPPVLDLGCGDGKFGLLLGRKFDVGLDIAQDDLKIAKATGIYREVIQAPADQLPFPAGRFQTVISNSTLEHLPNLKKTLLGVSRILKTKGKFIFTVPVNHYSKNLFYYRLLTKINSSLASSYAKKKNKQQEHRNLFYMGLWRKYLTDSDFKIIKEEYLLPVKATMVFDFFDQFCFLGARLLGKKRKPIVQKLTHHPIYNFLFEKLLKNYFIPGSKNDFSVVLIVAEKLPRKYN